MLPMLMSPAFPPLLRTALAVALALPIFPHALNVGAAIDWDPATLALLGAKETLVGMLVGFGFGVFFWVLASVGELIDTQVGNNNAGLFNAASDAVTGPFALFMSQFAVGFFFAIGGALLVVTAVYESYAVWPLESIGISGWHLLKTFMIEQTDGMMNAALKIASCALIAMVLAEVALGAIGRTAPALNVFSLAMPIKGVLAMLVMAIIVVLLEDTYVELVVNSQRALRGW